MESLIEKAKQIRLLILDVDGVLTSGTVFYGSNQTEIRDFHLHDGLGIKLLQNAGIPVAIITAKQAESVARRVKELHIQHVYLGQENKLPAFEDLKQKLNLANEAIAYMGDDLPDLPILKRVGLAMTVGEAPEIIRQKVHYIAKKPAGGGAVREACEFILGAQDKLASALASYDI